MTILLTNKSYIVSIRLQAAAYSVLFHHFVRFGRLTIFFITLPKGLGEMTLSLSFATFCRPNRGHRIHIMVVDITVALTTLFSHSIFFSITSTLRHRRDYDEQKAVVVVQTSLPGLPIKRETC